MSDRGYKALAFEIEAKALEAEIEGMKAENDHSLAIGHGIKYGEDAFNKSAESLEEIANKVRALV